MTEGSARPLKIKRKERNARQKNGFENMM